MRLHFEANNVLPAVEDALISFVLTTSHSLVQKHVLIMIL